MAPELFGTDGIRGTANVHPMTAETALKVGMAAGLQFTRGTHRHRVVIGKDTRLSGYLLEPALTAGFISVGMDVILVGPMPTPGIAMLTRSLRADMGVMISASHNPYQDNGIKLFGPDGYKLSDEVEAEIEARVSDGPGSRLAEPDALGRAMRLDDAEGRYIEFVKRTFPRRRSLDGVKVVIDCANGAAYKMAPTVLWELGAEVITEGVDPDGFNINQDCGSTAVQTMCAAVRSNGADLGIALDGDQIMGLVAAYWQNTDRLCGGGVVATIMSNLGLERYLAGLGLTLARTRVGDRYVVDYMRKHGFNLGGEQSGHIIFGDYATTGDGLIAALQTLAALAASGQPVSAAGRVFEPLPQTQRNVRINGLDPLGDAAVRKVITAGEERLGSDGRLVIRKSGTEPVIRVMAEGEDAALIGEIVDEIVGALERAAS